MYYTHERRFDVMRRLPLIPAYPQFPRMQDYRRGACDDGMRKSLRGLLTVLIVVAILGGCEPAIDANKECGGDRPLLALVAVAAINSNPNQSAQNKQTITDLMTLYLVTYEDCVQSLKKNESLF